MSGRDHSIECDLCGSFYGGLDGPDECWCRVHVELSEAFVFAMTETGEELLGRMATLAGNLRIAAGLCRAFELGSEYRMRAMIGLPASEDWKPGCGRSAP